MARPRSVPDRDIFQILLALIRAHGAKAVTFASVAEGVGLAPSSLAERHGSVTAMIAAARASAWTDMEAATEAALAAAPLSAKGAVAVLKALPDPLDLDLQAYPERALRWRLLLETSLAARLGGGEKGRISAVILFNHWLAEASWRAVGHRPVRLKDLLRALR